MVVATDGDGGDDDFFIHSEKLILLDKQKEFVVTINGTNENRKWRIDTRYKKITQ